MTHIVTDNCQACMFTDCVTVCPVDCFVDGGASDKMLFINPDECIDCGACIPECPVEAIYAEDELPEDKEKFIQINADKCEAGDLEIITDQRDPLDTAEAKKAELGF